MSRENHEACEGGGELVLLLELPPLPLPPTAPDEGEVEDAGPELELML